LIATSLDSFETLIVHSLTHHRKFYAWDQALQLLLFTDMNAFIEFSYVLKLNRFPLSCPRSQFVVERGWWKGPEQETSPRSLSLKNNLSGKSIHILYLLLI
jgi:hypothetical protein